MTREDENAKIIESINDQAKKLADFGVLEKTPINLGFVTVILADISRSLAIIADELINKEGKK